MKQDIINFLNNKKILIIGFGREGKSAFEFINKNVNYKELAIADKNDIKIDGIKTYTGDNYLDSTKDYDIVIKSPGIIIVIFPFESSITFVNIFNLILYLYYLLIVNKIIYIALFFDNLIIYK